MLRLVRSARQHEFIQGCCAITNLIIFRNYISTNLENNFQINCVFNDSKKSYESFDHLILLWKLSAIGCKGKLLMY